MSRKGLHHGLPLGMALVLVACSGSATEEPNGTVSAGAADAADLPPPDAAAGPSGPVDARGPADGPAGADRRSVDAPLAPSFAPPPCPGGFALCEDFEAAGLDSARWARWTNAAMLDLDPMRAVAGKRALHVKVTSTAEPPSCAADESTCVARGAHVQSTRTFPVGMNNLNVRLYVWIDKVTPDRWFPIVNIIDERKTGGFAVNVAPVSPKEGARLTFEVCANNRCLWAAEAPSERWACWEVEYLGKNAVNFYVDDKLLPKLTVKLEPNDPEVEGPLWLGFDQGHPDIHQHPNGFNIWIDEVAIGSGRIGCGVR